MSTLDLPSVTPEGRPVPPTPPRTPHPTPPAPVPVRAGSGDGVVVPAEAPGRAGRLGRRHVLLAGLLSAAGLLATSDAWAELLSLATADAEYSHVFLAPVVAAWLVYVRRARLRHCRAAGFLLGVPIVAVGWLLYWWGFNFRTTAAYTFGAVVVLVGCAVAGLGKNALLRFLPAVAVLGFLVPVPAGIRQAVAQKLQGWTAHTVAGMLDVLGQDATVDGINIFVNGAAVTIEEACNGMRLVFPLILVAYAFCFGLPLRTPVRLAVLLLSPLVCLVCNIARTLPIVWAYGTYTSPEGKAWVDWAHDQSGYVMLAIAFVLLYAVLRLLRWAGVPVDRFRLATRSV